MRNKVMIIGILPLEQQKTRTIAIARGEYKPKKGDPKVWFPSMASVSQVLSDENQCMLHIIAQNHPESLKELEDMTGRARSNLSRTLKKMAAYGLVKLHKAEGRRVVPEVLATAFDIKMGDWAFMNHHKQQQERVRTH